MPSTKSQKCGTMKINGRHRNIYKGEQDGVFYKKDGKKIYVDKTVSRPKKCGPGAKRSKSPRRKSPRRKSPRRKSPRRTSPRRTSHSAHHHTTKTAVKSKLEKDRLLHKHSQCTTPHRKPKPSPKRKRKRSPSPKCDSRKNPYKCKKTGKLAQPYKSGKSGHCHWCYAPKKK